MACGLVRHSCYWFLSARGAPPSNRAPRRSRRTKVADYKYATKPGRVSVSREPCCISLLRSSPISDLLMSSKSWRFTLLHIRPAGCPKASKMSKSGDWLLGVKAPGSGQNVFLSRNLPQRGRAATEGRSADILVRSKPGVLTTPECFLRCNTSDVAADKNVRAPTPLG
jgi:hypothetical protein